MNSHEKTFPGKRDFRSRNIGGKFLNSAYGTEIPTDLPSEEESEEKKKSGHPHSSREEVDSCKGSRSHNELLEGERKHGGKNGKSQDNRHQE